jgi:hypothetical protein
MRKSPRLSAIIVLVISFGLLVFAWPGVTSLLNGPNSSQARAQGQACTTIKSPTEIPSPDLINFDDLPNAAIIGTQYQMTYGVTFENTGVTRALIYGNEPARAHSSPNVAANDAVYPNTSSGVPMLWVFDKPKTHVGVYVGNGSATSQTAGLLNAYDSAHNLICQQRAVIPFDHSQFLGFNDPAGRIKSLTLDYGQTTLSESIDDLYFAPSHKPTRKPLPTWTPVPPPNPAPGPTPTPTPLVPAYAYINPNLSIFYPVLTQDLSIYGIEITQGIQCFDTSKGDTTCGNNTVPVVNKKDTTARIYLKYSGTGSSLSNVPVRLHIFANGVEYIANASGKATQTLNQVNPDSADVYFNVNFTNDINVSFYAEVDPDHAISETNESNNRYPSSGTITLTFHKRDTRKIVGQRLHYHPSGYSGSQYASGWAVNGGGADWLEQLLPIQNNGINYSVKSGYLDWTQNLSNPDNQHNLIKTLNSQWILQNALSWLFGTGAFTGADHVYGWAPSAGYGGGHADMPIYPHAGGLGVVGIGSDSPGTSTDNPGSGAEIFGHELVHDYNVYHTNTADSCGSNDGNSNFPYSSSSIQEVGFNPITGKIYDPATTHDLMSYCPSGGSKQGWISPFTWKTMYNRLVPSSAVANLSKGAAPVGVYALSGSAESLVINATVFNPAVHPDQSSKLGELYRVNGGLSYGVAPGDYAIELRDQNGGVLSSQSFVVDFTSEYTATAHSEGPQGPNDPPPFPSDPTGQIDVSFIIPWVDGTRSVALVHQGQVIDQRTVSSNAPQVTITAPTQAVVWPAGSTQALTWTGSDADGDPLSYSVMYSNDQGASWVLLASDMLTTTYNVDVDSMAGGADVSFRVVATDGINTGFDETDAAITIPNHPPMVTILNPQSGKAFAPGMLVVLQGTATDLEDGALPDSVLEWSSDIQGSLGIGPSVALNVLKPGHHVITLSAVDSYGIKSSTSVSVFIGHEMYVPLISK